MKHNYTQTARLMKNILIVLILFFSVKTYSQDYNALWKDIETLDNKGLTKSALKKLKNIEFLAKKDNNQTQQIKALLYKSKYLLTLEEDAQLKIVNTIKQSINSSAFPKKNILQNVLANLYWDYFKQNRWRFYNRSKTSKKVNPNDFRTWDLQTLFTDISSLHNEALEPALMLQLEDLSAYNNILILEKNSKTYRPTLYDFLCNDALNFYKTKERNITKPAYNFKINNINFLSDARTFSKLSITSKHNNSLKLNALKIYQKLIAFHLKNNNIEALTEINIDRLKYVREHATFANTNPVFLKTLNQELSKIKNHSSSSLYDYEIAYLNNTLASSFIPITEEKHHWKAKESLEICNRVISKHPNSRAAKKCAILKQNITQPLLQITAEDFLPTQKDAKTLIYYKNINNVNFKIFKITNAQLEKWHKTKHSSESKKAFLNKLKIYKNWSNKLPNKNDYQAHRVEITIPKLIQGNYIIFAETDTASKIFAIKSFYVTDVAVVKNADNKFNIFQFINRNNGAPLKNTMVTFNYTVDNLNNNTTKQYTTNNFGEVKIKKDTHYYRNLSVRVEAPNNKVIFNNYYLSKIYEQYKKTTTHKAFTFTDRAIYRPTQTVYFKSIFIKKDTLKTTVSANQNCYATLYNSNNEKLKTLSLQTNNFGSIHGAFTLPKTGLNGQYYIVVGNTYNSVKDRHYFAVEDYKRPKFNVAFLPISKSYKINESINITGKSLAFTGSAITNAKVAYRVERKTKHLHWSFWRKPYYNNQNQEIAHGTSTTNNKGEFTINFKAIPDPGAKKENRPIFTYTVTVDVTDINGETRSNTTHVNVGYHSLIALIDVADNIYKSKKEQQININTTNLDGVFTPAKGQVKIYKLLAPNQVFRPRPWETPDYKILNKNEFKARFPHDAYNNENLEANWKKGDLVLEKDFNTSLSKTIALNKIKTWKPGAYLIILETKDKDGQSVTQQAKTVLHDTNSKLVADHALFSITTNKESYTTSESAIVTLKSAASPISITLQTEKNNTIVKTQIITLNNSSKSITIPINKNDLGGFYINYSYAAFNSFNTNKLFIKVPYPSNELQIETATFRDQLKPDTKETWSFKIKGPKGEKINSEILASMYDMSLDQFKKQPWTFNPVKKQPYYSRQQILGYKSFGTSKFRIFNKLYPNNNYPVQNYDHLNWFGFNFSNNRGKMRFKSMAARSLQKGERGTEILENIEIVEDEIEAPLALPPNNIKEVPTNNTLNEESTFFNTVGIRKNHKETAFFIPQLQTDSKGHVSFTFNTPETLTQWKLQLLAHTKNLQSITKNFTVITKKELIVTPNTPRFLRQGDTIIISTKISNTTNKPIYGKVILQLFDAITNKKIDDELNNYNAQKDFNLNANENKSVSWALQVPINLQALKYKIIAKSDTFSDGEQNVIPVLSNRKLVTETLPLWVNSNTTKTFNLEKLQNNTSKTLTHHKLTLELTSNPAWYAVMALPYLIEKPYASNEQNFSKYYSNSLAQHITQSNPKIEEIFNLWKNTDVLTSNLEKNEALKNILIQETPWLKDAQSEAEQKKRIALLFDTNTLNNELKNSFNKLKNNQMASGAWSWFKGGKANRYITQHIITGLGHLKKLNVSQLQENETIINKAIAYLDNEFIETYKKQKKYNNKYINPIQLHYLYMRSFYPNIKKTNNLKEITNYYQQIINNSWLKHTLYSKGLMALISYRNGNLKTCSNILKSLKEQSITSNELGMYWKTNTNSWHWHQAPIETQSLLIEAYAEAGLTIHNNTENAKTIDQLKIWLLKNKQTNRWKSTKATTKAIYALLLNGSNWIKSNTPVEVTIGDKNITTSSIEQEAGTGYYKKSWNNEEIKANMSQVTLSKKGKGVAWGSLYWQYFEDLNNITSAKTPLQISKKLFLKSNTDTGEVLTEITEESSLNIGDLVRVRIEIKSDRNMSFLHMKDMRASGLEPINVISGHKWQDGLSYYQSTRDANTSFFFDYLKKGIYVFEYDLRANNSGYMSNGITNIQCMYAPEFSSHSEGIKLRIK